MERRRTYEPMLSQLARVTDTSQLPIEIQNVARRRARAGYRHRPHNVLCRAVSRLAKVAESDAMARSPRDIRQEFQKRNAALCEATSVDSVQRSWIVVTRFRDVMGSF